MNSKNNSMFIRAEEIAQYFINQAPQKSYSKNLKMLNMKNYHTLKDSLNLNDSDSSLSTKTVSQGIAQNNDQTFYTQSCHMKQNSIQINKDMIKYAEPRFKVPSSIKIPQKFSNVTNPLTSSIQFKHMISPSESELLEIDEKVPQIKIDMIEAKKSFCMPQSFNFALLTEIEKKYEDLLRDLKGNGLGNMSYKEKVCAEYFSLIISDDNTLGSIFEWNKDVNKFLIKELSIFLILMFISEYKNLTENELIAFKTCLSYAHLNFLFVVMIIVNKYRENVDTFQLVKNDVNYEKCATLIDINSSRIDTKKYQLNFNSQNKIVKNVIFNLLSNLKESNNTEQVNTIFGIFNSLKQTKYNEVKKSVQSNNILINKVKEIIEKNLQSESTESLNEEEDEEQLPQPEVPFLKPKSNNNKEYTLVLDLDETLVHYFQDEKEESAYVKVRMGTERFITSLSEYCEIVIFTASTQYVSDYINYFSMQI